VIQLRDKQATSKKLYEESLLLRQLTRETGVPFIVNDRLDIALASEADGVHLGQDDLPIPAARKVLGSDKILGCSAGTLEEAIQGEREGADYIGVGPVFEARDTKPDAGQPRGLHLIDQIKAVCHIPVVAIGGINHANAQAVLNAGADCLAVISAVVTAEDIRQATLDLKTIITSGARTE
ncbi:MAG TPA: thiamine phosphate synthase, partial [bacterium]|nr:thiamine phosphate synthase [bacterium]